MAGRIKTCGECVHFPKEGDQYRRCMCMDGTQPLTEADRVRNFCEHWDNGENENA